jgi:hypothetical protein
MYKAIETNVLLIVIGSIFILNIKLLASFMQLVSIALYMNTP